MMHFYFKNIEDMKENLSHDNVQESILDYLRASERYCGLRYDTESIFHEFEAEFEDFRVGWEEIRDPEKIIDATLFKEQHQKREAAEFLHELIYSVYVKLG